jgi:hypothetical protein
MKCCPGSYGGRSGGAPPPRPPPPGSAHNLLDTTTDDEAEHMFEHAPTPSQVKSLKNFLEKILRDINKNTPFFLVLLVLSLGIFVPGSSETLILCMLSFGLVPLSDPS